MSQAHVPMPTERAYGPPSVTQFSVFLDNKVGRLHDLLEAFDREPRCWICALSVLDASDYAVIRVITSSADITCRILRAKGLSFAETEVLVVELARGHSLNQLCLHLLAAELNIRFAYPLLFRRRDTPAVAISVDDLHLAGQLLRRKNYTIVGEAELPGP